MIVVNKTFLKDGVGPYAPLFIYPRNKRQKKKFSAPYDGFLGVWSRIVL